MNTQPSESPSQQTGPRKPLRVMFLLTSMPVGGAETLLVNLVRGLDKTRFAPEICCLKQRDTLGEEIALEIPVFSELLTSKFDPRILFRLTRLMRRRSIDAVVTVGAGDKMFWGRLAARLARVPVVISALHSTGWPDGVGKLNRLLTPLTDAFVAVAPPHGQYLVEQEQFPAEKVHVIPNGVDTDRFRPDNDARRQLRRALSLPEQTPVAGIVAALRPEKNHQMYLRIAKQVRQKVPRATFLIIGEGECRDQIESARREFGLEEAVRMLGTRSDIEQILPALDVFILTSKNEANPVSILEALACQTPVVSTKVGSIADVVADGTTGYLVDPEDEIKMSDRVVQLMRDADLAARMGAAGREVIVSQWSLPQMVIGYENLIESIFYRKQNRVTQSPENVRFSENRQEEELACVESR